MIDLFAGLASLRVTVVSLLVSCHLRALFADEDAFAALKPLVVAKQKIQIRNARVMAIRDNLLCPHVLPEVVFL